MIIIMYANLTTNTMNVLDIFNSVDPNGFVSDAPVKTCTKTLTIADKQGSVVLTKQCPAGFQIEYYSIAIRKILSSDYHMELSLIYGVVHWVIKMDGEIHYTITLN